MPAPATGQLPVTSSVQQLTSDAHSYTAFTIKAPRANTHIVYVGPVAVTTSTGYPLEPGEVFTYERNDQNGQNPYQIRPSEFYAVGTSGDILAWLASP